MLTLDLAVVRDLLNRCVTSGGKLFGAKCILYTQRTAQNPPTLADFLECDFTGYDTGGNALTWDADRQYPDGDVGHSARTQFQGDDGTTYDTVSNNVLGYALTDSGGTALLGFEDFANPIVMGGSQTQLDLTVQTKLDPSVSYGDAVAS